ncbi:MAG: DUF1702 family protein [Sandaracinaceae bacterium]
MGAGRALWFLTAGDAGAIVARLERVDVARRPLVLRGVGVASAFAGGATEAGRARLEALGPTYADGFAHGASSAS